MRFGCVMMSFCTGGVLLIGYQSALGRIICVMKTPPELDVMSIFYYVVLFSNALACIFQNCPKAYSL